MTSSRPDYSLWLIPRPGLARTSLLVEIQRLGKEVGGASLVPHITLVPHAGHDRNRAVAVACRLAQEILSDFLPCRSRVLSMGLQLGAHRYQSVMLAIRQERWLMDLNRRAESLLGRPPPRYFPHLSLVYADLTTERRNALAATLRPLPELIPISRIGVFRVITGSESRRCIWSWPIPRPGERPKTIPRSA